METGKRQHLQDIYATDHSNRDDFTPQVASEIIEERKREIRRHQFVSFVLGMTVLVLAISLVYVVVREYIDILKAQNVPEPIQQEYIPRYSLPAEAQWVMDFNRSYSDPKWDGEGERPFSAGWVKKAAFNIILAEQAVETRKYNEAAEYYENTLEILPDIEGVKVPLGMAYFKLGKNDKALELLKDAPEADLTFDVLNNLGAACIEAKAYDKGEEYLLRSLGLKPAYAEAFRNLAVLYRDKSEAEKAVNAYEQYLDQRPKDTDTRYNFALYLTKIGNWELAGEQLRKLTEEVTDVANLYFLLARVENKLGNSADAVAALQRGVQLTDPKLAMAWMSEEEFDLLREEEEFQSLMKYVERGAPKK
jgi:tetratricopeptide (TPR) repeat protein